MSVRDNSLADTRLSERPTLKAGAMLTGLAFILPSLLMVVVLAALYVHYGWLAWIPGLFYGIGAAVIAIMAESAYRLARRILGRDRFLWLLFAAIGIATAWTGSEMILVFLLSGLLTLWIRTRRPLVGKPAALSSLFGFPGPLTGVHGMASAATIGKLLLFFLKAGAFVFGSGLAIVPFLYGGVVGQYHWLRQFLDAVAVAMVTPGPVVIIAAFIGYLVGGPIGAVATSLICAALPDGASRCAVLSPFGSESVGKGFCSGCECGCGRCHRRRGVYPRPSHPHRSSDCADQLGCPHSNTHGKENP